MLDRLTDDIIHHYRSFSLKARERLAEDRTGRKRGEAWQEKCVGREFVFRTRRRVSLMRDEGPLSDAPKMIHRPTKHRHYPPLHYLLFVSRSLSLSLLLSVSLYITLPLYLFLSLNPSLSTSLCLSLCLSLSVCLSIYLSPPNFLNP